MDTSADDLAICAANILDRRSRIPDDTLFNRFTRDVLAAQAACFALGAAGFLADEHAILSLDLACEKELRARHGITSPP